MSQRTRKSFLFQWFSLRAHKRWKMRCMCVCVCARVDMRQECTEMYGNVYAVNLNMKSSYESICVIIVNMLSKSLYRFFYQSTWHGGRCMKWKPKSNWPFFSNCIKLSMHYTSKKKSLVRSFLRIVPCSSLSYRLFVVCATTSQW